LTRGPVELLSPITLYFQWVAELLRITRAVDFSTSLRYWRGDLSDAKNRELFGPQSRQHGHNYRLEVTLIGEPDPLTGMVLDLKDLQQILDDEIMTRFDHRDLNSDTPYFEKDPPTPENFAQVIYGILRAAIPGGLLDRVRLRQDSDVWVDVFEAVVTNASQSG
jgi:6-pyruvoyltetrahydropterin/6-carboxytetrahydropterin synthase